MGVAEQNMASVASGMAAMGKVPFIGSYAIFSPGRNWEQIRTTICYNNRPVIIVGSHIGVSVGPDGGSHQALEDIALMRVLPNMTVLSPCDAMEARKATLAAAEMFSPVYLRLSRNPTAVVTTEETPFKVGKAQVLYGSEKEKSDVGIIATGSLVHKALLVAQHLKKENIKATVLNVSTIKPLDEEAIISLAKNTGAIVTVEEHQIVGGLGSSVAECLAQSHPTTMRFVGVRDKFGQSGTPDELFRHYGLDETSIISAVKKILAKK
jgi:transketolase